MSETPETIWTCDHVGEYGHYFPEAVEAEGEYGGKAIKYRRADIPPTLSADLIRLRAENEALRAERDDAQSGTWPQWARTILSFLQEFGWRFDDLIDLPEELENYLREYPDSAVDGLQEQVSTLRASEARMREALTIAETTIADLERANASYQSALSERGIDGSKGTEE